MILAILLMAAEAAKDDGIVANGTITVGASVVTGILTYLATKRHSEKVSKSVSEAVPQPCTIEQSRYQAAMRANEHDHENLFNRVAKLESKVEGIGARVDAKFEAISEQLRETKEMVRQLFDRICKRK